MQTYIDFSETLFIIVAAIVSTSIAEFVSWYFVYRTDEYENLKKKIDVGLIKYNKQKDQFVKESNQKVHEKKSSQMETSLKALNQEMTTMKMKSNAGIGLLAIITLTSLGSYYQGVVVAKLPFLPFSLMQNITHRGLIGSDYTDCSYIFLYILTGLVFRANIQKIFGFEGVKLPFQYPAYGQSPFQK